jgi:uncharacterized membrane protein
MPGPTSSGSAASTATHLQRARQGHPPATAVNVGEGERMASLIGGTAVALYGLSRGTLGGLGLALLGGSLIYRGVTGHCSAYQALGLDTARPPGPQDSVRAQHGVRVDETVTILRPREELYRYWRDLSNLPRIMRHLESVQTTSENRSHWTAKGPFDLRIEWDAEIITERENELIGWRSVGESEVDTAGSVHFIPAPGGRGTEVRVELKYDPPGGRLGSQLASLLGQSPERQIREDLRRFKAVMESGTAPTTEGQPGGHSA